METKISNLTGPEQVIVNLLADRTCKNCTAPRDKSRCCVWLGEACGWQWMNMDPTGTCAVWSNE